MSELSFVALTPTSFLARSALVHGDRIAVIDGARPQRPDLLLCDLDLAFHASLRIATGGAPPSPALLERFDELGIEITHLYGLTETFGPVVICDWRGSWDDLPAGDGETLGEIALLRDRLKDVIVSGGENIASVEVEQAIQRRGVRGRPAQDGHREGPEVPAARAIPERPDGAGRPREVNGWITKR